jgi:hypothetical protein
VPARTAAAAGTQGIPLKEGLSLQQACKVQQQLQQQLGHQQNMIRQQQDVLIGMIQDDKHDSLTQ